jgi:ribosomal protein L7Ae-like RNA K-turn-binding protein
LPRSLKRRVKFTFEELLGVIDESYRAEFESVLRAARRNRRIVTDMSAVTEAVRSGLARLVVVASDAAAGRRDAARSLAGDCRVRIVPESGERMGCLLGRVPVEVAAVTDRRIAEQLDSVTTRRAAFAEDS